jgi:hypothetical protein
MSDRKLRNELLRVKKKELLKCKYDTNTKSKNSNSIESKSVKNRKIQCALLNLPKTTTQIKTIVGKGKYNFVNRIDIDIPKSSRSIPNVQMLKNTNDIIVKHNIAKSNTDVLKHESLIGMYLNYLVEYTPNFYYTYDIRKLDNINNVKKDRYIMNSSQDITESKKEKYGILGEYIKNITIRKFLDSRPPNSDKIIPNLMLQILFTLYIAGRELDFIHFDLHDENVVVTETTTQKIDYIIPLTPSTYKKLFGQYKDGKRWDLKTDQWIFDNERDDSNSFRTPINTKIRNDTDINSVSETKKCLFENKKIKGKYYRKYKHFNVSVKTYGYMIKIIDYNFSVVKVDGKLIESRHTNSLYRDFDLNLPDKSYLYIDMFRLCYLMYSNYGYLSTRFMLDVFGEYFEDILVGKVAYLEDMSGSRILKSDLNIYDPKYQYTGQTDSRFVYAMDIDAIPIRNKNNEDFLNLCYKMIEKNL